MPASTRNATLIGASAVFMWGMLALLTTLTGKVPPFLLAALAFGTATVFVTLKWLLRGEDIRAHLHQPPRVWLLGVSGLFGYHFFYFMALRNAPPLEAGLIAYMWPLLIVLFSALLPGERLRWYHFAGAVVGLGGATLLITGGNGLDGFKTEFVLGYIMAGCCAFTWSIYSVLNRRFAHVPTDAVGGFCGATALLSAICHILFETTQWPADNGEWLAIIALGMLPVGMSFFTWDYGTKHGDIRVLGAFAYAAPLISTVLLIVFGKGDATWSVAAGCVLIIGGAVLAAREMLFVKPSRSHTET